MIQPISYLQTDSKWKTIPYATKGESSTIGSAGCGPTAAAMLIATLKDQSVTPVTTCKWSLANNYKALNQGTYYDYIVAQLLAYGITSKRLTSSSIYGKANAPEFVEALASLQAGNALIAVMGKGIWTSSGHYIVVYKYENGTIYVNDPASTSANRTKNTWANFTQQVKQLYTVDIPAEFKSDSAGYTEAKFIFDVCTLVGVTSAAAALYKVPTISETINSTHKLVTPLERYMKQHGLYTGIIEADHGKQPKFGANMGKAINRYQSEVLHFSNTDRKISAGGTMWKYLLGLK